MESIRVLPMYVQNVGLALEMNNVDAMDCFLEQIVNSLHAMV
jgi:hypothetical protein